MDILPLEVKLEEYSDDEQIQEINNAAQIAQNNMMFVQENNTILANGLEAYTTTQQTKKMPFPGRVPCAYCDKTFKSLAIYRLHEKIHTGEGVYTCEICQKVFGQRSHYVDHVAIHSTFRPFRCSECPSSFKEKNTLRRHQQRKHGLLGGLRKTKFTIQQESIPKEPVNTDPNTKTVVQISTDSNSKTNSALFPMEVTSTLPPKVPIGMKVVIGDEKIVVKEEKSEVNTSCYNGFKVQENEPVLKQQNNNGQKVLYAFGQNRKKIILNGNPNLSIESRACEVKTHNTKLEKPNNLPEVSISIKKNTKLPNNLHQRAENRSPSPELTLDDFLRDD